MSSSELEMKDKTTMPSSYHVEDATADPEAAKSDAIYTYVPSPEAERKFVRKLDRTILPFIMVMYLLSYMDRSNLGNSRGIGLEKDLHLTSNQYALASAVFYIGTFVFATPGGLMLKVVKPSTWLAVCLIGWGAMGTLQAATHNAGGLIATRFLLGVFEASFAPGCAFYLSFWYLKTELSLRIAAYNGMSAVSGIVSGLLSYGIGAAKDSLALAPWQVLFIVEGLPTVALGFLTFWLLPDRPEAGKSHWFSDEEQEIALSRRYRFTQQQDNGIDLQHVKEAFLDYRLYLFTFIYAGLSLSLAVLSVFLPTIIGSVGYSGVKANLMTVPVYGAAYIVLLATAWLSDRWQNRSILVAIGGCLTGVGYLLLGVVTERHARYAFTFLIAVGTYMAVPLILAWIPSTFGADTKSGVGIGIVIAVTHAVGIAASNIYPSCDAPQYVTGTAVSSSLTFATCFGALILAGLLYRENQKRDRKYGKPEEGAVVHLGADADRNPNFRYML